MFTTVARQSRLRSELRGHYTASPAIIILVGSLQLNAHEPFVQLEPRRAAVSLIMRIRPPEVYTRPEKSTYEVPSLEAFFQQDWVRHSEARAEVLFIRRDKSKQNFKDVRGAAGAGGATGGAPAHVAFPGGRTEENDEGALYTGGFLAFRTHFVAWILDP